MIKFNCPRCGKVFWFDDEKAGQRLSCSECGAAIEVPAAEVELMAADDADIVGDDELQVAVDESEGLTPINTPSPQTGDDDFGLAPVSDAPATPQQRNTSMAHISPTLGQAVSDMLEDEIRVDGNYVVVSSTARLLQRCVVTGERVSKDEMVSTTVYYAHLLILLFIAIFCSPLLAFSFYVATRVPCSVTYGIKPQYRALRLGMAFLSVLTMVGSFAFLYAAVAYKHPPATAGMLMLFFLVFLGTSIFCAYYGTGPIRVAKYDGDKYWLRGFCEKYLRAERAARERQGNTL